MADSRVENLTQSINSNLYDDFKKSILEGIDLQFVLILAIALILETVVALFMAGKPVEEYSQNEIERIQERFANFVLKQPEIQSVSDTEIDLTGSAGGAGQSAESEESGQEGGGGDDSGSSGGGNRESSSEARQATRMADAEARRASRANLSAQVSNKGLLGMLTGTGTSVDGSAVSSLFGESGSGTLTGDLDKVLSSAGGLRTQGQSGLGGGSGSGNGFGDVRGSRSGQKAGIDDLVSDVGSTGSASLSRKGDLMVETPADISGRGSKSSYRSSEAIQEVLLGHVSAIQYCYERELKRNPTLKGKVVVRITVSPDGQVTNVSILSSTLNNDRVERCIISRIQLWKDFKPIDATEGDISFRQTYTFGY